MISQKSVAWSLVVGLASSLAAAGCGDAGEPSGLGGADGTGTGGVGTGTGGNSSASGGTGTGTGGAVPASGGSVASGGTEAGSGGTSGLPDIGDVNDKGWKLVWSDEFDGSAIDGAKWEHEVNCDGGGNNELQCYVTDAKNSFVTGGQLHIVALKDNPPGKEYSSARLRTRNKGDFKYGRFEARIQVPFGKGLWPAFWMLPTDNVYGGWARSGELDIMETVNATPDNNLAYGTLHYGDAWPGNVHTGSQWEPATFIGSTFFTYTVEWEEGEIRWFIDDKHYETQDDWYSNGSAFPAPFNQEFHMLLNVAVGGNWPGSPDGSATFPQEMIVDYVRVYQCSTDMETGIGCGTSDPAIQPL